MSRSESINILIITANFPPILTGGASIYFKILTDNLKLEKVIRRIVVLTEYVEGEKLVSRNGNMYVLRFLFPKAGKKRTKPWSFSIRLFSFAFNQFVLWFFLPVLTVLFRTQVIHIHANFFQVSRKLSCYNFITHIPLYSLTKLGFCKVLVDVRNVNECFRQFKSFDIILCCSENIVRKCRELGLNEDKCVLVPIPFSLPQYLDLTCPDMTKLRQYICFVGAIQRSKGIFELIEAFNQLNGLRDIKLVIVGVNLEGERFLRKVQENQQIHYIGSKSQEEVLAIISQAELFILPSKSEGLPRSCLEAMALGTKVLLPPGIPEFDRYCSEFVIPHIEPIEIAEAIGRSFLDRIKAEYPLMIHDPLIIGNQMTDIYKDLLELQQ